MRQTALLKAAAAVFASMLLWHPAGASSARVLALGFNGLVPDGENDLNFNPAFIENITEKSLFANVDFTHEKNATFFDNGITQTRSDSRSTSITPTLEYVHPFSSSLAALRVGKQYGRSKFVNSPFEEFRNTFDGSGRAIWGGTLGVLHAGASFEFGHSRETVNSNLLNTLKDKGSFWGSQFGIIAPLSEETRLGFTVGTRRDRQRSAGFPAAASQSTLVRVIPEFGTSRGLVEIGFNNRPAGFDNSVDYRAGYSHLAIVSADRLLVFGFDASGTRSSSLLSEDAGFKIGMEEALFSNKLILRGSFVPLRYVYTKTEFGAAGDKTYSLEGPVSSYTLGLGFNATEKLLFDISFDAAPSIISSERESNAGSFSGDDFQRFNLQFAATYRL